MSLANTHSILTFEEERSKNLMPAFKKEYKGIAPVSDRKSYIMNTKEGFYIVFKEDGLWYCGCQYNEKTGVPCSHLVKVLIYRDEPFELYIHPRWKIRPEQLTNRILSYKHVKPFLHLRSRHKVHVKG